MAGTLLTTSALTTMVPAAFAEGDDHEDDNGDGNKNRAEDESQIAQNDCDDNEEALCIAANVGELALEL